MLPVLYLALIFAIDLRWCISIFADVPHIIQVLPKELSVNLLAHLMLMNVSGSGISPVIKV